MPTSWSSILCVVCVALAIAGAALWSVVLVGGLAFVIEMIFDLSAAFSAMRTKR